MEIDILMNHRRNADILASLPVRMQQVAAGETLHCGEMLAELMVRLARG